MTCEFSRTSAPSLWMVSGHRQQVSGVRIITPGSDSGSQRTNYFMDVRPVLHQQPPRFAVGGVLYRYSANGELEIVLIKKQGGSWTLPKGQMEANETTSAALMREMAEEVALSGSVETLLSTIAYPIKKRGQVRQKVVQYYLMRVRSGKPRPNRREGIRQARWFALPLALQRVQTERIREVIEQAIVYLNQHA